MKKAVRLSVLFALLITSFLFVGCDESEPVLPQLQAPTWGTVCEDFLTWSAVNNSEGYVVSINDRVQDVFGTQLSTEELNEGVGKIIKVKAKSTENFTDSDWSEAIVIDKINPPLSVEISENGELAWLSNENARGYSVTVFNEDLNVVKTMAVSIPLMRAKVIRVQTDDLPLGKYTFEILPIGGMDMGLNLSKRAEVEFVKSLIQKHIHSFSKSAENLHLKASFKMRENLDVTNYNFTSTNPSEQLAEYNKAYKDLFEGTDEEKFEAINVIGNDVIFHYYYFQNGEKVDMTTKNKAWNSYLNRYTDTENSTPLDIENIEGSLIFQTLQKEYYFRTNTNVNYTSLNADNNTIFMELVIIKDGNLFTESAEVNL